MQLYLIRHAESENNALTINPNYSKTRSMDPELTSLGIRQADYLANFISKSPEESPDIEDLHNRSGYSFTHLYSSLMVRAVATGTAVAQALNLPLLAWPDWHEGGGIYMEDEATGEPVGYPGKDQSYFSQTYPSLVWPAHQPPGGWWDRPFEERPQRWERARRVLDELMIRHARKEDRVAVITHGGFYNYFMKTLLGVEHEAMVWFVWHNTAITRIDFTVGEIRLVYQNRLEHLPAELISLG